jgi:hypothetical protein
VSDSSSIILIFEDNSSYQIGGFDFLCFLLGGLRLAGFGTHCGFAWPFGPSEQTVRHFLFSFVLRRNEFLLLLLLGSLNDKNRRFHFSILVVGCWLFFLLVLFSKSSSSYSWRIFSKALVICLVG